ncbi:PREDICTED: bone morphogenetic protein 7-like [Tinamus guttatus]|uniref:bone morphogenetic protein 7-like n=1 Tax=Tinamus guttatus TaxID=94827 RepID=UPI00052F0A51|nr:PREDICTED: bone morphogenetic protein 7-like [Tinamus guttatus]
MALCLRPQVSVYQVLDKMRPEAPEGRKLLASRLLALQGSGWEVFAITQAVRDWTEDESSNQGLLVSVQSLAGGPPDPPGVRFASGRDHHESKKPMLVLFTDDGRRGASLPTGAFPGPQAPILPAKMTAPKGSGPRSARSLDRLQPCQRHPLSVDFEEIGWSGWIISPRGYNAYHCKGACPFPLGENMRPTNHATVQSIINALKLSEGVSSPCCVPDKLYSINLLYFDDDENVVLKQYDDMVAGSCGCHCCRRKEHPAARVPPGAPGGCTEIWPRCKTTLREPPSCKTGTKEAGGSNAGTWSVVPSVATVASSATGPGRARAELRLD